MPNKDFDYLIKRTLKSAAEEIQENPYEKNKIMKIIKNREAFDMRNKKRFSKRAIIVIAAIACLSATTAFAAGGTLNGWFSSTSLNQPTYETIEELTEAENDLSFTPLAIEEFANGYAFDQATINEMDGKDAENNTICTVDQLETTYQNADGNKITLTAEKMPQSVDTTDTTVYEGQTDYNDITIKYNKDLYKLVGDNYTPTAEEESQIAAGQLYISSDGGNHEPEYYNIVSVSWSINGVDYKLWGFDYETDLTESQLYEMAAEIIDLQVAK